jgi:hypothetical protein
MDLGIPHLFAYDFEIKGQRGLSPCDRTEPQGRLIVLPSSMMMASSTTSGRLMPKTIDDRALAYQTMVAYSGPCKAEGEQRLT